MTNNMLPVEFPIDKWLRKHVTPGRLILGVLIYLAFLCVGPLLLGKFYTIIVMGLLYIILITVPFMMIWRVYWIIKHPTKVEFCKECGRAKTIKYKD